MHRRSFLKAVAVGGGAAGTGGCAHLGGALSMSHDEVLAIVEKLSAQLAAVSAPGSMARAQRGIPDEVRADPRFQQGEGLLRDSTRTLFLAGTLHGLPLDVQAHPAVQELIGAHAEEMSDTVHRAHASVLATTPEERRAVTLRLREDPELLARSAQRMDEGAAALGATLEQRAKLSALFRQVGNRMTQSAPLFIEEYGRKVHRIAARTADDRAVEREFIARMGEQAFSEYQLRLAAASRSWDQVIRTAPVFPTAQEAVRKQKSEEMHGATKAGLVMLGIAPVLAGVGGLLLLATWGGFGVFFLTAGALLLIAALITLLVGALSS